MLLRDLDARTDHAAVMFQPEQKRQSGILPVPTALQAMLTVLIILSLISLLVATEAEPASTPVPPRVRPPVRPSKSPAVKIPDREQIAA